MSEKNNVAVADKVATQNFEQIALDYPIQRGDETIDSVSLRQPKAGELRGASLADLAQMDVTALSRVLPRITSPVLTDGEIRNMAPADLFQLGAGVAGFLLPKSMKQDAAATG